MKRFIKTKRGKIEDLDTMTFDSALPKENYIKFNAVKQSDNIEDLFDAYVCIVENYDAVYCTCLIPLKESWESCTEEERKLRKIYGAVWTDKGLIYVAKMNEKGVLCLI